MPRNERFTRWGKRKEPEAALAGGSGLASGAAARASVESLESMLKASVPSIPGIQVRHWNGNLERRAAAMRGRTIRGLAIPYGVMTSDLGDGHTELYKPGSFSESLAADDVRALFNNNVDRVLGRKSAGTLSLTEDRAGVHVEISAPETGYGDDVLTLIRRGDVDQMTAAFYILEHRWETIGDTRCCVVTRGKLLAVSVSTFSLLVGAGCSADAAVAAARAEGFREGRAAGIEEARFENARAKRKRALAGIGARKPEWLTRAENMTGGRR
jgi:HK97 family phage prohead protease